VDGLATLDRKRSLDLPALVDGADTQSEELTLILLDEDRYAWTV